MRRLVIAVKSAEVQCFLITFKWRNCYRADSNQRLILRTFNFCNLKADLPARISSLCTVFAESEIISLIAKGEKRANIIAGIHESICVRVLAMANRIGIKSPVMMTGGVAKNIGVVRAFEKAIGSPIEVSDYAQVNGAIGAALLAQDL